MALPEPSYLVASQVNLVLPLSGRKWHAEPVTCTRELSREAFSLLPLLKFSI